MKEELCNYLNQAGDNYDIVTVTGDSGGIGTVNFHLLSSFRKLFVIGQNSK